VRYPGRRRDEAPCPGAEEIVSDQELVLAGEHVERVDVILVGVRVDALEVGAEAELDHLELRKIAQDSVVPLPAGDVLAAFRPERCDPVR